MANLPFWFHPSVTAEALAIHDRYFDVTPDLAEDLQSELERPRVVIARSPSTWPNYIHGTQRCLLKRFQVTSRITHHPKSPPVDKI